MADQRSGEVRDEKDQKIVNGQVTVHDTNGEVGKQRGELGYENIQKRKKEIDLETRPIKMVRVKRGAYVDRTHRLREPFRAARYDENQEDDQLAFGRDASRHDYFAVAPLNVYTEEDQSGLASSSGGGSGGGTEVSLRVSSNSDGEAEVVTQTLTPETGSDVIVASEKSIIGEERGINLPRLGHEPTSSELHYTNRGAREGQSSSLPDPLECVTLTTARLVERDTQLTEIIGGQDTQNDPASCNTCRSYAPCPSVEINALKEKLEAMQRDQNARETSMLRDQKAREAAMLRDQQAREEMMQAKLEAERKHFEDMLQSCLEVERKRSEDRLNEQFNAFMRQHLSGPSPPHEPPPT